MCFFGLGHRLQYIVGACHITICLEAHIRTKNPLIRRGNVSRSTYMTCVVNDGLRCFPFSRIVGYCVFNHDAVIPAVERIYKGPRYALKAKYMRERDERSHDLIERSAPDQRSLQQRRALSDHAPSRTTQMELSLPRSHSSFSHRSEAEAVVSTSHPDSIRVREKEKYLFL